MVTELRQLMKTHGLLYAIAVLRDGRVIEIGEKDALEHPGIADEYFFRNPQGVFEWLEGQILPQLVAQGRVVAFIHKPKDDLVIGLFSHRDDDVVARFKLATQIDRQLEALVMPT